METAEDVRILWARISKQTMRSESQFLILRQIVLEIVTGHQVQPVHIILARKRNSEQKNHDYSEQCQNECVAK